MLARFSCFLQSLYAGRAGNWSRPFFDLKIKSMANEIQSQTEQLKAQIENNFTYHAPKANQPDRYENLREKGKNLALTIVDSCPHSRERSLALTKLEESIMWANAAIARNE